MIFHCGGSEYIFIVYCSREIQETGYAGDQNYASTLSSMMVTNNLSKYGS